MSNRNSPGTAYRSCVAASKSDVAHCIFIPGRTKHRVYLKMNGELFNTAHLVLEMIGKERPSQNHFALHEPVICNNTACINPRHLRWGTNQENQNDRSLDGTSNRGPQNGRAVLSEDHVLLIRGHQLSDARTAKVFGVSKENIRDIRTGRIWKHVKGGGR